MKKIRFGTIHADYVTLHETLNKIEHLALSGAGGFVVTPNVDHVVMAQSDTRLREAYRDASLSLVDGMPLKWMSTLVGEPLPEKISGSDLVRPLLRMAAQKALRVYFLGAAPGIARKAADVLQTEIPNLQIVGVDSPPPGFEQNEQTEQQAFDKMRATQPHLTLMALGCPKQELLMHRWHRMHGGVVYLGIGASLDFIAGNVKRCPPWMAQMGVEWLFRISQDPKRLAHRYLVRDRAVVPIFLKMMRSPREKIIFESPKQ